ncbi:MAG: hypothetical protein EOO65_00785 [Methanosarcinales archaeon]|nr:MAG: hypothetical protein EOO65_00785 [Methanosarcinales archaeon]
MAEVARGRLNSHFVESFGGVNMYEGVQSAFTYRLWDADKHQTCACDPGYTGSDCSLRECAHGDDPLTDTADMCGNEACRDEVQGFSIAVASNTDKTYRIRFYDYFGRTFVTNDFVIKTAGTDAANSANAQAVKYALQALPSNVTGLVTVSSTKNKFNNIRVLVTFTTLSGNVPEFDVVPGVVNGGAVAVAQPRQPVQLVSFSATPPTTHTVSLQLYPKDNTGFQALQFVGASTDNLPAAESTDAERTAKAAVFSQALMTGASASSAFVYEFGTVANNDNGVNVAYNTDSGTYDFQVVMPNKNWGSVPMKVTISTTSATVTVDTRDGNREHSMCSNRGTCDFTTGMCNCFGGYTGGACQLQNVLAF